MSPLRVVILGSTGPSGLELVRACLAAGHRVTALARTPSKMEIEHERLRVAQADVLDTYSLVNGIEEHDVVLSALGAKPSRQEITLYSQGITRLIDAMGQCGVTRLFAITAAALQAEDPNLPWYFRAIIRPLFLQRLYDDMNRMEDLLRASDLDWTLVRPPRLTDGPATGVYRALEGYSMAGGATLSRADLAHFIVEHLNDDALIAKGMAVAY